MGHVRGNFGLIRGERSGKWGARGQGVERLSAVGTFSVRLKTLNWQLTAANLFQSLAAGVLTRKEGNDMKSLEKYCSVQMFVTRNILCVSVLSPGKR